MLRPDAQTRIYEAITGWKGAHADSYGPFVTNAHRGLGKSFMAALMCVERCLKSPGQQVRFGAPTYTQAETIFLPIFKRILTECPLELQPEKRLNTWTFKNPRWENQGESILYVVSLKDDAEQLRGPRSNLFVIDEARDVPNLEYVVNDVIMYHFTDQEDPLLVMFSTLPKSLDHPFVNVYMKRARRQGAYIKIGGDEDLDVNPRDVEALLDAVNRDTGSPTWQREWLCNEVPDTEALIIPEFQKVRDEVVLPSRTRPEWFVPLVFADFGYHDLTAILFAYIDRLENVLVVEDEIVASNLAIGELAARIHAKERELWPEPKHPVKRIGDATALELADLRRSYGLEFTAADRLNVYPQERFDDDSACSLLRTVVATKKIRILKKCEELIYQLSNGIRDEKGKFMRGERVGHCDAISALVYGNRQAPWSFWPFPFEQTREFDKYVMRETRPQGTVPVIMGTFKIPGIESWN